MTSQTKILVMGATGYIGGSIQAVAEVDIIVATVSTRSKYATYVSW
jgi:uncharacterized protein YbjT (DUF2867 family)